MNFFRFLLNFIPDKLYLQLIFFKHFHRFINFKNPKTFNEKLQWLKLYNRKPEYTMMVDKYLVKEYVALKIGGEYIIPTLGVWDHPHEIDFCKLPNQFVLKWNHDSGSIVICKDKEQFDVQEAIKKLKIADGRTGYWYGREWPYKNVEPKIIAEKYMEDYGTEELRDYKFFCFDGRVQLMFVASDRQNSTVDTKFDFFDRDFVHLSIKQGHPNADKKIEKPQNFNLMIQLAEMLSKGMPHVRVDFYEVNGRVFFGEMTFFHFSGFVPFEPNLWDEKLGKMLQIG